MSYLVSNLNLKKLKLYVGKRTYAICGCNDSHGPSDSLIIERIKKDDHGNKITIEVSHKLYWFSRVYLGFYKVHKEPKFIPSLSIKVKVNDQVVTYLDEVLLTGNIGPGFDIKGFLTGSDKNKYRVVQNGLSYRLGILDADDLRIANYTLDHSVTTIARRGFIKDVLELANKISYIEFT